MPERVQMTRRKGGWRKDYVGGDVLLELANGKDT